MTYTTTLKTVEKAGIGVKVVNENVGTGDSTETSFELNNGFIIATSYSFKYAAAGSNSFTALVETTDYVLEKEGGTILLTTAGKTALSTNILYATYTHSPKIGEEVLNSWLAATDEEVDLLTYNYWGASKANTEYFDGIKSDNYPTTDRPYGLVDYDAPDYVQLKYKSVQSLSGAYFLTRGKSISNAQSSDGGVYTDVTAEINTLGGTAFNPFAATTAANDYLYIGSSFKFHGFQTVLFNLGVTSGTNTLEYWNGTAWTAITTTESTTGVLNFSAQGKVTWDALSSWTANTVNSSSSLYFIRVVANDTYTTEATLNHIAMDQNFVIQKELPLYAVDVDADGKCVFIKDRFTNGTRNIRVDYTHGYTTTPGMVEELASMLMGIRAYANITGGSYDDATSYQLPEISLSIGEVYVNVAEVTRQFKARIEFILQELGKKYVCF